MKKISLQWKLTFLTTVLITILCGCLTFFLYKNGVYYFDTLQESITDQGTEPESVYIDIPDNEWDDFVSQFSMKVYKQKPSDYCYCSAVWLRSDLFYQWTGIETTQEIFRDSGKSSGTESERLYDRRE